MTIMVIKNMIKIIIKCKIYSAPKELRLSPLYLKIYCLAMYSIYFDDAVPTAKYDKLILRSFPIHNRVLI